MQILLIGPECVTSRYARRKKLTEYQTVQHAYQIEGRRGSFEIHLLQGYKNLPDWPAISAGLKRMRIFDKVEIIEV